MDLFVQYGALDSVTSYSSHSYAFVFFKRIEVAKAAKDTLQDVNLHGHPIKSESDSEAGTRSGGAEVEEEESVIPIQVCMLFRAIYEFANHQNRQEHDEI
uniref:RRM domain-containing protein n=1 Tax=Quercus lobata TaxID=97700 RepID=A0A7N2LBN5_QUELO